MGEIRDENHNKIKILRAVGKAIREVVGST
jgi:hypothetical protein